jgi:hypothetical protein
MDLKMSKREKIAGILLITIVASLSIAAALQVSGYVIGYSTGTSMQPTWKNVNIIWGHKPHTASEIQNGSIVCFHWQNISVTHRIVDILKDADGAPVFNALGDNLEDNFNGTVGQSFNFSQIIMVVDGHFGLW